MFFITQLIGLAVINAYIPIQQQVEINGTIYNVTVNPLPYGMQPPELKPQTSLTTIVIAMIIAILLVLFLTKFKAAMFLRLWFFLVVIIALGITFNAVFFKFANKVLEITFFSHMLQFSIAPALALIIALPLAFYKIFKQNLLIHNITELLIYPGIAAVFVPILNLWTVIVLLLLISIYDIYAVWHSGFMQQMAKFQINQLKVFAGFFVPYLSKSQKSRIKKLKKQDPEKLKNKKVRVQLAILGGGDVVFPIITAGIIFKLFGFFPALVVSLTATLSLFLLFVYARKGKFYPAMPFLTAGLLVGMALAYILPF